MKKIVLLVKYFLYFIFAVLILLLALMHRYSFICFDERYCR